MAEGSIGVGYVVAGRYKLVRRLGEGGMGAVWVADDETLRSQVAIKLLHGAVQDTEDGLKRFLREAQAAARLRSPHVVQILEHGVDAGVPFIAMELLEGESLAARLERLSTLSLAQTARVVTHVARAIGKAHDAGIVHRDLKPDNVFIVHNDDEEVVKVLDFGIAKMEAHLADPSAKVSTQEGSLLGTPLYMSPEQVRGHGVDARSDLWSLAMIAFECVCGRLPFDGRTVGDILVSICSDPLPVPSTFRPLPPTFDAWFARAATRDPAGRFQSAKEMADALRAIVGDDMRTPAVESGPVRQVSADAATMDAGRHALERAATISASSRGPSTIGGAASAVPAPEKRRAGLLVGLPIVAALAVGGWLATRSTRPARTGQPAASVTAPNVASVAEAPPPPASVASVAVATSASAPASASAHARSAPSARPGRHTSVVKSDELTF